MMEASLWSLLLLGFAVTHSDAARPGSCVGRCGEVFTRGQQCTCDFSCLRHNECCQDFQATCTTDQSCQGRCGEMFSRGRLCECDEQCSQYSTCCQDYQLHCDAVVSVSHSRTAQPLRAAASGNRSPGRGWGDSNSESEEWYSGGSNLPSHGGVRHSPAAGSSLPSLSALSLGSGAPVGPSTPGAVDGVLNAHLLLAPAGGATSGPSQGLSGPEGFRPRPSTLQDVAQALGLSEGQGTGLLADVNLCSDSPIDGLTALSNGTILIFKGELLWSVDPVSRSVGGPQMITDTLGVSSPIDTVFTRCNCHAHTYIIKGEQLWRLDGNMVMEPGYPRPLTSEFPGLTGRISAVLAVPATRSSPEIVYFFKSGDVMQRFSFPAGSAPCSNTPRTPPKARFTRQAVLRGAEVNIRVSLKGFPSPVTSALSLPRPLMGGLYEHYIFSGPLFFSVHISGDLPVLTTPRPPAAPARTPILSPVLYSDLTNMATQNANTPPPANSIRVWLRCP
ncbi:proteoglycan 4a [Eleginops maclovinus]|uniref:proteoglycan 4a n=1 Tax=Eleginops maclovinus TaxID=56733 RepID=UPI003080F3F4